MKKTLLLLLVWLLQTNPAAAQGPGDYQFQFQFDNSLKEWVQGPDGAWFGLGWSLAYPGFPKVMPFVIKWDAENDVVLWKTSVTIPYAESMKDVALLPALDGGVFVGAVANGCDYPTPEGLARIDAFGNPQWVILTPDNLRLNDKVWLLPGANGNVVFQTEKHQFIYSQDGSVHKHKQRSLRLERDCSEQCRRLSGLWGQYDRIVQPIFCSVLPRHYQPCGPSALRRMAAPRPGQAVSLLLSLGHPSTKDIAIHQALVEGVLGR
ncbi:MAG: hypothetical protein IPM98_11575 [Lewinellaceae bacterium]|nr:hypothetical protein [Lewinellaceae bacterium]